MPNSELASFFERHECFSADVRAARDAWSEGAEVTVPDRTVSAGQLLDVYRLRAANLFAQPSEHARQLAGKIATFCENLAQDLGRAVQMVLVATADGRVFTLWEDVQASRLIGAWFSYDARKITDEEYLRIWEQPRPYSPFDES